MLPASANIVANGSFESPVGNGTAIPSPGGGNFVWSVGAGVYVYDANQPEAMPAQDGSQTMAMFAGAANNYIYQTIPTVAGKKYQLSFWTKGWNNTPGATLNVEWLSDGINLIQNWFYESMPSGWTKTTITNIAAGNNDIIRFTLAWSSPAHIVIDDVRVDESSNLVANGSFELPRGNGTAIPSPGGGSFVWEVGAGVNVYDANQPEAMPAQDGTQTMVMFAGSNNNYISQKIPTVSGKIYDLSFWTKGWNNTPGASLDVEWLSGGINQIGGWYYVSMPGGWTKNVIRGIRAGCGDTILFEIPYLSPAHLVIDDVRIEESNLVENGSFEKPATATGVRCDAWGANAWTPITGNPESIYIYNSAGVGLRLC